MHKVVTYVNPRVSLCQQTFSSGIGNYVGQNLCELCNLCAIVQQLGGCLKFIVFRGLFCIEYSHFYPPEFRGPYIVKW